jgi:hypothetical protein
VTAAERNFHAKISVGFGDSFQIRFLIFSSLLQKITKVDHAFSNFTMHYCLNCHRAVLDEVPFCPTCGAAQSPQAAATSGPEVSQNQSISAPPLPSPPPAPSYSVPTSVSEQGITYRIQRKSPWTSAILNLFIPGTGYIYNGIGQDSSQVVFGILCFLALFVGIFVSAILEDLFVSTPTTTGINPIQYLSLLVFLVPFALAYDGYKRAIKINERSVPS